MSRRVKPEELELWKQVARSADPLHPPKARTVKEPGALSAPAKPKARVAQPPALPSFTLGSGRKPAPETRDLMPQLAEDLRRAPVKMDARAYKSMQRGKLKPEARIDLHGMTVAQAHPALTGFILSSVSAHKRLVLVITGKGGRREEPGAIAPRGMGALKRQVPHWLSVPPLAGFVLQVTEAHLRHGGSGAYYVYLRRS